MHGVQEVEAKLPIAKNFLITVEKLHAVYLDLLPEIFVIRLQRRDSVGLLQEDTYLEGGASFFHFLSVVLCVPLLTQCLGDFDCFG